MHEARAVEECPGGAKEEAFLHSEAKKKTFTHTLKHLNVAMKIFF